MGHLVYPGAEHSRFTHSLGVFNFARRIIDKLLCRHWDDPDIYEELKRNTDAITAAALLHDVGHGPFSHVFERVFREEGGDVKTHDEWTCDILRDTQSELHQRLAEVDGVTVDEVCGLISDSAPGPRQPYLKDIVSSQLDADRMDYLLRDSLMTGSRYGQFDSEWILNALVIAEPPLGAPPVKKLCLDARKGTGAIEGLLFARLLMYTYVYGHKAVRAYEAELIQTLRLALTLKDQLPPDTPEPVRKLLEGEGKLSINDYLMLDDDVVWWALRGWAAWDGNVPGNEQDGRSLARHALRLVRRHQPWATVKLDENQFIRAGKFVKNLENECNPLRFECFIDRFEDLPYKDYRYLRHEESDEEQAFYREIFIVDSGNPPKRLSELAANSPVLSALMTEREVCRFHYDREKKKDFSGLLA
ncbi:MAG: HD domain-containing protein [Planctomycetes bacterium]|nr:HD domain-containing protein [Planctomycetota bacterium]